MKKAKLVIPILTALLAAACSSVHEEDYTVRRGPFLQTFTETGELEAVSAVALTMPRIKDEFGYEMKLLYLADQGALVKKGDTVIRIDPASVEKFIITKEEAIDNEKAAEKKQLVQMENSIQDLRAQLRSEQATYDLKKLELERSQYEPENKRRIKELEFRQSTIRIKKIKRQLERKPILDQYDYKIQKIKLLQSQSDLADARDVLNRLVILSPQEGLFQLATNRYQYPPTDLKVGDRVGSGSLIARLPDIQHMKVRTSVNETDISRISLGMKVLVRLDALPEVPFHGEISDIGKACIPTMENGVEKDKVFKVVVTIQESDLRLKPGMTVSCEYVCQEIEDAVFVPNNCLLKEGGKAWVYIKKGGSAQKTEVTAGPANSYHTLITGPLEPGQALIPFDQVLTSKKS